jgi:hypothetical protein
MDRKAKRTERERGRSRECREVLIGKILTEILIDILLGFSKTSLLFREKPTLLGVVNDFEHGS